MRKLTYILFSAAVMLASCAENEVLTETQAKKDSAIEFAYSLPSNSTRTVITAQTGFPVGGAMAVDGFQTDAVGNVYQIFANDRVWLTDDGVNWSYNTTRYWDISSTYVFYAMYPYEVDHSFDRTSRYYTINNYVVANNKADQKDVMIAEEKAAMPENKVTLNFNHLLSQVNFFLKASSQFNTNGIEGIECTSFHLTGVKNTGTYAQTGYNPQNLNVEGAWTVADEGEYNMPAVTAAEKVTNTNPVATIEDGLLLMPQNLKGVKAQVSYRILYAGGASASYSAEVPMAKALISKKQNSDGDGSNYVTAWRPNYVYNYYLAVNPSQRGIDDYDVDIDGSKGGGDGVPTPDVHIVIDGDGNWWIDEDGDGIGDVRIVWEDIDGDGKLEGGVDRDGDGHIDNADGDNNNPGDNPLVTDGNPNNPDGKDVILVDTDGDGKCDTQLERDGDTFTPDPVRNMNIEFSADVEGFENEIDANAE